MENIGNVLLWVAFAAVIVGLIAKRHLMKKWYNLCQLLGVIVVLAGFVLELQSMPCHMKAPWSPDALLNRINMALLVFAGGVALFSIGFLGEAFHACITRGQK